jgi:hypothetical protein
LRLGYKGKFNFTVKTFACFLGLPQQRGFDYLFTIKAFAASTVVFDLIKVCLLSVIQTAIKALYSSTLLLLFGYAPNVKA